jgi:uncharacterized protein
MPLGFLIFLAAVLTFLFGMHYAFFRSIIHFFDITHPAGKIGLYTIMVVLIFSFISAFMLLHRYPNAWTVGYYWIAATWTGFLIHFVVAVGMVWAMIGISRIIGYPIPLKSTAMLFLVGAILFSLWGLWRSFYPEVREIEIPVASKAGDWRDYRIVHITDAHLGFVRGRSFADRLTDQVNALNPDLIMITGDLFDGIGGFYEDFIEPLNRLQAGGGIFFVTGNHEHYAGIENTLSIIHKTGITLLDNEMITINGLEIIGVSYPGIRNTSEITGFEKATATDSYRLLLFHTPTSVLVSAAGRKSSHIATYWMPDTSYDVNRQMGIDLQLSGHTHHGQIFPFNLITRLLYRGNDYGLTRHNGLYLYTSSGVGTWGPPLRTAGKSEIVLIRFHQADAEF